MSEMSWVEATYYDGGFAHRESKCVFFISCHDGKLQEGKWFGYFLNDGVTSPFILNRGTELFFGDEEHYRETTNLAKINIREGEYFTVAVPSGDADEGEYTYCITRIVNTPFTHR